MAAKVAASVGLLAWLFYSVDWEKFRSVAGAVPIWVLFAGLLLACIAQLLAARRLQILLRAQHVEISYVLSVNLTFMGLFAGNFLPSTVGGDAVKIVMLARKGFGKSVSTLSIVADRLLGLFALVMLLPLIMATPRIFGLDTIRTLAIVMGVGALFGAVVLGLVVLYAARFARTPGSPGSGLAARVVQLRSMLAFRISLWATRPRDIAVGFGLSVASILIGIASVWIQAQPMGFSVSFMEFVAVYTLICLATLPPISVNGLGVQEVAFVYLFSHLGATPEQALALALVARALNLVTSLPGALFLLSNKTD